jgi:hypothetical protein
MSRGAAITAIQSIAIVLGCAAVGLSLTRVPGGEAADALFMTLGGAILGLIGVTVGFVVRAPAQKLERHRSPIQLVGLRITTVGLIVAVVGWLIAVFLSADLGWLIGVIGAVSGIAGIVIHNVNMVRGVK